MAMGIVSDRDFILEQEKLNKPKPDSNQSINQSNQSKVIVIDPPNLGRPKEGLEVPNGLRNLIGTDAIENGRASALELASNFGISPSSVSAYTNGATSTSTYDNKPNGNKIQEVKDRISTRARNKISMALRHITEDKLKDAKLKDVSSVAKDMSTIVKNMEGNNPVNPGEGGPTFIFYSPRIRNEESFKVIDMQEK